MIEKKNILQVGCLCLLLSLLCLPAVADDKASAADKAKATRIKKLAEKLAKATIKGDYKVVVEHTYAKVITLLGGKEKALKVVQMQLGQLKARGIEIKSYEVGKPGKEMTEGKNTFVVIPTSMEMTFPAGRIQTKSYLLGISADKGKTWTFADGSGMKSKANRAKILPKLPAKLKLPAPTQPKIIPKKS